MRQSAEKDYFLYKNRPGRHLRTPSPMVGLKPDMVNGRDAHTDRFQKDDPFSTKQKVQERLSNVFKDFRQVLNTFLGVSQGLLGR